MPHAKPRKKAEVLVLCIDRDDDLGKKADVRGPVVGEEENLKAAKALALADPEDSDLNAIYAAVKAKRDAEQLYRSVEIATLTGDKEVGVKSDHKVVGQLQKVLDTFTPKGVIFVTDGAEDDEIIPLIQSYTKILSKKTVTVKQAKPLESAYFKILDFFGRVSENRNQAMMIFGLPGLFLLLVTLLSLLRLPVYEIILLMLGLYLITKGAGFEEQVFSAAAEIKNSMMEGKIPRIFNAIAILLLVMAAVNGYLNVQSNSNVIIVGNYVSIDPRTNESVTLDIRPDTVSEAIVKAPVTTGNLIFHGSIYWFVLAVGLVGLGSILHNLKEKKYLHIKKHLYTIAFLIIVAYFVSNDTIYWLLIAADNQHIDVQVPETMDPLQNSLVALIIAIVVIFMVYYLLKVIFFDYVERKRALEEQFLGREVYSKDGKKIGEVTKIELKGNELRGIHVKRRYMPENEITSNGKVLVVKENSEK
ncbi:MAG: DUF373 family protein [Candidatus Altiarchaeota archaeon]|nr:DUF373 family protein [Candidatus Altiarchaeota archaeon]